MHTWLSGQTATVLFNKIAHLSEQSIDIFLPFKADPHTLSPNKAVLATAHSEQCDSSKSMIDSVTFDACVQIIWINMYKLLYYISFKSVVTYVVTLLLYIGTYS